MLSLRPARRTQALRASLGTRDVLLSHAACKRKSKSKQRAFAIKSVSLRRAMRTSCCSATGPSPLCSAALQARRLQGREQTSCLRSSPHKRYSLAGKVQRARILQRLTLRFRHCILWGVFASASFRRAPCMPHRLTLQPGCAVRLPAGLSRCLQEKSKQRAKPLPQSAQRYASAVMQLAGGRQAARQRNEERKVKRLRSTAPLLPA